MTADQPDREALALRYDCELSRLPVKLRNRFVQLGPDAALEAYLGIAQKARHGRAITALHRALRGYLSDFDINGLLGTYPMHVLGTEQWRFLLDGDGSNEPQGRLLDVGAGNGDVTRQLAPLFQHVVTTETSRAMAWRLKRQGFACHRVDVAESAVPGGPYTAISCLNVLDRCDRPLALLAHLRTALDAGGLLILALVFPYNPFVYEGAGSRDPRERLPLDGGDWESSVSDLCLRVLEPLGLEIVSVARAPYLSGGDARRALYELDDAVVVCRAIGKTLTL